MLWFQQCALHDPRVRQSGTLTVEGEVMPAMVESAAMAEEAAVEEVAETLAAG